MLSQSTSYIRMDHLLTDCPGLQDHVLQRAFTVEPMQAVAATSDGMYVAGGGASGTIYIWATGSGQLLRSWPAHYKVTTHMHPFIHLCIHALIQSCIGEHDPVGLHGLGWCTGFRGPNHEPYHDIAVASICSVSMHVAPPCLCDICLVSYIVQRCLTNLHVAQLCLCTTLGKRRDSLPLGNCTKKHLVCIPAVLCGQRACSCSTLTFCEWRQLQPMSGKDIFCLHVLC